MPQSALATTILSASVRFEEQRFKTPLVLSTGPIEIITEAIAEVTVSVGGREATGRGSIYLSDLWAWPDPALDHATRDGVLRRWTRWVASNLASLVGGEAAHPLELGLCLHAAVHDAELDGPMPTDLAKALCMAAFDAAMHDAAGVALGCSAFAFYERDEPIPAADGVFEHGAIPAIRQLIVRRPATKTSPAWWVVGKHDDLDKDVRPVVEKQGFHCFKIKIAGKDNAVDVAQVLAVYRAAREWGVGEIQLTLDSNEGNPDAMSVLDFLERLRSADEEAFEALRYLEQPTGRDIERFPNDWSAVSKLKPVLVDEGLTSLALLEETLRQGWSGLALKTCKGHSFALTCAAWAHSRGMMLSLQDLTNPGLSLIHGALFGVHVPTINGVELNSPQYTPDANAAWLPRLAGLFQPRGGRHQLPPADTIGLGSRL